MASPAVTSHSQEHLSDPPVLSVRSGHWIHLPARYNDYLPAEPQVLVMSPLHQTALVPPCNPHLLQTLQMIPSNLHLSSIKLSLITWVCSIFTPPNQHLFLMWITAFSLMWKCPPWILPAPQNMSQIVIQHQVTLPLRLDYPRTSLLRTFF